MNLPPYTPTAKPIKGWHSKRDDLSGCEIRLCRVKVMGGVTHIKRVCITHDFSVPGSEMISQKKLKDSGIVLDTLPEYEVEFNGEPCFRCQQNGVIVSAQLHHFYPHAVALQSGEDSDLWQTGWLCVKHHEQWHREVQKLKGYEIPEVNSNDKKENEMSDYNVPFADKFQKIGALWPSKSGNGFSGTLELPGQDQLRIVMFAGKSDNTKAPAWQIYIPKDDAKQPQSEQPESGYHAPTNLAPGEDVPF